MHVVVHCSVFRVFSWHSVSFVLFLFCPQRLAAVCCVFCTLFVLSSAVFRCKFDSGRPQFDGGRPLFAACVLS